MRASGIDLSFTPRRATTAYTEELDGECVILDEAGKRASFDFTQPPRPPLILDPYPTRR